MNVNELPQYKCHKVVRAGKIRATGRDPNADAVFLDIDGVGNKWLYVPAGWLEKHSVEIGGYLVVYDGGYTSYSPAAAFEAGYSVYIPEAEIDLNAADFSDALMWLKEGKRVQRAGWNGKDLWLEYRASLGTVDLPYIQLIYPVPGDGSLPYPNGARVPWVPSQTDMLADDWRVV